MNENLEYLKSLVGKRIKVDLTDGRSLIGNFYCVDKDSNLCLNRCKEYLPGSNKSREIGMGLVTAKTLKSIFLSKAKETT